jgi:twitching motility protein PilU
MQVFEHRRCWDAINLDQFAPFNGMWVDMKHRKAICLHIWSGRSAGLPAQAAQGDASHGRSDLFISADFPPSVKAQGAMKPLSQQKLTGHVTRALALSIMNEKQQREFEAELECNFAISLPEVCRFRVNVFVQQQSVGMVIRTIASGNSQGLALPEVLKDIIMTKRGLVLVVGGTGSGKSTTLAAMIDYRNANSAGHIITVEDPVEYVHKNKGCLITHREVGVDTLSWHNALKNTCARRRT